MVKSQLDPIRIAFAADVPTYTRDLAGASVNGQSFTFAHNGIEYTREEFAALLQDAYAQLGDTRYGLPPGNRTAASFAGYGTYFGGSGINWNR